MALLGGNLLNIDGKDTSANPAFRKTLLHFVSWTDFDTEELDMDTRNYHFSKVNQKMEKMREITPNSGAYINDSDYFEPDWERSFWGNNYEKLKEIKEKYDPDRVFSVWNGVGGTRPETGSFLDSIFSPRKI